MKFCRFLLFNEYLITRYHHCVSNHKNIKWKHRIFIIIPFNSQKIITVWYDFKMHEGCFLQFYVNNNSWRLIGNLQYMYSDLKWISDILLQYMAQFFTSILLIKMDRVLLTKIDRDTPSTKQMANPLTLVDQLRVVELEIYKSKSSININKMTASVFPHP